MANLRCYLDRLTDFLRLVIPIFSMTAATYMQDFFDCAGHSRSTAQRLPYHCHKSNVQAIGQSEIHLMSQESQESSSDESGEFRSIQLSRSDPFFSKPSQITTIYHCIPKIPRHQRLGWSTVKLSERLLTIHYSLEIYASLETTWRVVLDSQWYNWSVIVLIVISCV